MDTTVIAEGVNSAAALDFSVWGLFMKADWVVKSVMIVLVLFSVWTWAIIIDKWLAFGGLNSKAKSFENTFWSGRSLEEINRRVGQRKDHPMAVVFAAAMKEWENFYEYGGGSVSIEERLSRTMSVSITKELGRVERNLPTLATIGSVAPFIGLFGTVWGIMNSFQAIAVSRDTNLAVVAPGIAEALFATALGLIAAIPAVVAYNKFSADLGRYGTRLEGFVGEFSAILSRQLDDRRT